MTPQQYIPIIVAVGVVALVLLKNRAPRTLHPERLWIVPAFVLPLIGLGLWGSQYNPAVGPSHMGPADWAIVAVGLALGAVVGWQRGRTVTIQRTADGTLKAQASPLGLVLIVALLATRSTLRPWLEGHATDWGLSVLAFEYAFLLFAAGLIVAQRIEMYIRAKHIQRGEPDAHVELTT